MRTQRGGWRLDSKKLEALVTAVELGSFTRASEQLGYTQSGLTHMMNSLEKEFGFTVLVRSRSGVHLTAAGERVYPMIKDCLRTSRNLEREIHLVNSSKEDTVHLAAYASIATHWLPEVIERFRDRHRDVSVDILMGSVEEVYRWVREGKVDMAFASRREGSDLGWLPLRDDPLIAILPRSYDMGGARTFPIEGFAGKEFLMPAMGFELDIMPPLNRRGVTPNIQSTQVSDSAVISMVEHGLGFSILSELVLRGRQGDVQALPLYPPAVRQLGIAYRSNEVMRLSAREFMKAAGEMIPQM